jgi:hypothetical protein
MMMVFMINSAEIPLCSHHLENKNTSDFIVAHQHNSKYTGVKGDWNDAMRYCTLPAQFDISSFTLSTESYA